ncbi:MAG: NADH-quinone oxidoreductase subunit C [Alphaproteobacteria bacterium CG_4_10_14_0_8_um_filter_53_9]|nr:MAG: NADH-quinone oxidoreductase subunit C [Alphaproteobacteria bacterium CG_4_10_14_0_8_um_filter_53_9]
MSNLAPHIDTALDVKALDKLKTYLEKTYKAQGGIVTSDRNELTLHLPKKSLPAVMQTLRDDAQTRFTQLMDLTAVDWLGKNKLEERFHVVYHLLSLEHNLRLRVILTTGYSASGKAQKPDTTLADPVPSLQSLFPAATWYEREVFDMFGIPFTDAQDLRRILTDYGFQGHPLRKDFPVFGYEEVFFNEATSQVEYKAVDMPQETRFFNATSPWEGVNNPTPLADEDNTFPNKALK